MFVRELYLGGVGDRAIEDRASKRFGVTTRQVRTYIARVKARLAAEGVANPGPARLRSEELLLEALGVARDAGDARAMSLIAVRLADLHGALVQRMEHSGEVRTTGTITLRWPDDPPADDPPAGGDPPDAAPAPG